GLVGGLRLQPDVPNAADLFVDQPLYQLDAFVSAFELDRFRTAVLHEPQGILDGFVFAGVETSVRHVGDEQRALHGASHGLQVNQNFFERYGDGVAVTQDHVSQAIANENDVDTCFINQACGRIVVGR